MRSTVETVGTPVVWRGAGATARRLDGEVGTASNDHGDVTGSRGAARGTGAQAWVGRRGSDRVTSLPHPPADDPGSWSNTAGVAVIRGVTDFAPQGGVSVGGNAEGVLADNSFFSRAVIWTCATAQ